MKIGIFDHLDRRDVPLQQYYSDRLALVEQYDRSGFHAYHVAEHHQTPLGMSPSPSVYLSAVAQRTTRLRFGPLVYTLPLYHPLRLADEICMLDHMSGGRLELGVGRGISPIEVGYFGVDVARSQAIYLESFEVLMKALREPVLNHQGPHFQYRDVPMVLHPLQRPHPPIWYGVGNLEGVDWCAAHGVNAVANGPLARIREITDRYRLRWAQASKPPSALPLIGTSRHLVVAGTDAAARAVAARAYAGWHRSFMHLWRANGITAPFAAFPEDFGAACELGLVVAGSADTVRDVLLGQIERTGVNYLLGRFAFGDLALDESLESLERFTADIMPALVRLTPAVSLG